MLAQGSLALKTASQSRGTALCDVRRFGAVGDALTYDTAAIQRAIDDRACGAVILPLGGIFLTGALNLTSDMELVVDGILRGSVRPEHYPIIPAFPTYGICRDWPIPMDRLFAQHQALVAGWHLRNVTIRGQGVIDGNGAEWWARWYRRQLVWGRPRLVEPMFSTGIKIHGVTLKDSPFWSLHPYVCKDVHIHDIIVSAPRNEIAPNTDGIDPDSCTDVLIERVIVDVGDNAMAIKSGMDQAGVQAGLPSANITIRDSRFVSESWAIGSEMSGGVYNVTVDNCHFGDPFGRVWKAGAMIKTADGRGGEVRNVTIKNSVFHQADRDPSGSHGMPPLSVSMFYHDPPGSPLRKLVSKPPVFTDFSYENVTLNCGTVCEFAGEFVGLTSSPIKNMRFRGIKVEKGTFKAWQCGNVEYIEAPGLPLPHSEACPRVNQTTGKTYDWRLDDEPTRAPPALPAADTGARVVPLDVPESSVGLGLALVRLFCLVGVVLLVYLVMQVMKVVQRIEKVVNERPTAEEARTAPPKRGAVEAIRKCGQTLGLRKCSGSWAHSLDRSTGRTPLGSLASIVEPTHANARSSQLQAPLLPAAGP
jgi:hypothetical protein